MASKIVLLRHGESIWNLYNIFTGWTDVDLDDEGKYEALHAGHILREEGFQFDIVYTSVLRRAIHTAWHTLDVLDQIYLPFVKSWKLNERHYGFLQGKNKSETTEQYGKDQVHIWRRSYAIAPPPLEKDDPRAPHHSKKYTDIPEKELPLTESLKNTYERVIPYFEETILPEIKKGKKIIIVAHGNSLRALVKYFDNISDDDISTLNIPTGVPLVYELDEEFKATKHYYLGDQKYIDNKINKVAHQADKKST